MLLRALKFESRGRYKSAGEFGEKLARALLEPRKATKPRWAKVTGALIILVLLSFGPFKYLRRTNTPEPNRPFTYWLTVQKMPDGKVYQGPPKSNGQEVFENGDSFTMKVTVYGYNATQTTVARGKSDLLVTLLQLNH
jgi:hypothetical protein